MYPRMFHFLLYNVEVYIQLLICQNIIFILTMLHLFACLDGKQEDTLLY